MYFNFLKMVRLVKSLHVALCTKTRTSHFGRTCEYQGNYVRRGNTQFRFQVKQLLRVKISKAAGPVHVRPGRHSGRPHRLPMTCPATGAPYLPAYQPHARPVHPPGVFISERHGRHRQGLISTISRRNCTLSVAPGDGRASVSHWKGSHRICHTDITRFTYNLS